MGDSKEEKLVELKEWVGRTRHIPKDMDEKLLRRFLHSCYYDLGKAQKAMEAFTSLRATSSELFTDRDPQGPRIQKALQMANLAQYRISGNRNVWIIQLNDPGLQKFDHLEFVRNFFISTDAWFLEEDNLQDEDITIFDAKDVGLKIFWKLKMSIQKKLLKYQQEAIPIRLKQMHLVNAPYFIDRLFAIMKQFISKEVSEMIKFHVPNSDTLFNFFSKDELPKDFGGNLDSLEVYTKQVVNLLQKHRVNLMKEDLWRAPEEN